jgi:uncharacterized protein
LITDRHVDLFRRYRVHVGFSIDGPGALNDARQAKDPTATRATTSLSLRNLDRLLAEGVSVSLIVTLHALNARLTSLQTLVDWLLALRDKGLKYVNLHTLEPHGDSALALSPASQTFALRTLRQKLVGFASVSPFDDMRKSLLQESGANCIWNFCDPYTTAAVHGVDGQGQRSNCGRTNVDGVAYQKGDVAGKERYLALYLTPQEHGGCAECRFFVPCGGGNCPGEAIDGDWRNRTVHCATLKALFIDIEQELRAEGREPISCSLRRPALEAQLLGQWSGVRATGNVAHGDSPHGDAPHGDSHGDHTDAPAV